MRTIPLLSVGYTLDTEATPSTTSTTLRGAVLMVKMLTLAILLELSPLIFFASSK
jgi:hypothetical protein